MLELERIPTKVILDGLKRNMSRGNSLSDEVELRSVLVDTRAYLYRLRYQVGSTYPSGRGTETRMGNRQMAQ